MFLSSYGGINYISHNNIEDIMNSHTSSDTMQWAS
jgi:hypothetical protein